MYKPIAIIGVAFRFAQAETLASFWDILKNKIDLITESKRFDENILGAFLDDINCFDGEFFNIVPEEAKLIDPQHRFLLETSWLALEDAGIISKNLAGSDTSVFIGIGSSDYFQLIGDTPVDGPGVDAGNDRCMAANRISYYYDFHGTSLSIDTACSSALVAIDSCLS